MPVPPGDYPKQNIGLGVPSPAAEHDGGKKFIMSQQFTDLFQYLSS